MGFVREEHRPKMVKGQTLLSRNAALVFGRRGLKLSWDNQFSLGA